MTATETAVRLAQIAGHAAADKLATDIVLIDVSDRLAITDVFVIASGNNERQVEAIVDEIEEKLRLAGSKPLRREGKRDGRWVLLDYADIVVHVQHVEERVFYSLERLWKDCPAIEFDPMAPAPTVPNAIPANRFEEADAEPEAEDDEVGVEADQAENEYAEAETESGIDEADIDEANLHGVDAGDAATAGGAAADEA